MKAMTDYQQRNAWFWLKIMFVALPLLAAGKWIHYRCSAGIDEAPTGVRVGQCVERTYKSGFDIDPYRVWGEVVKITKRDYYIVVKGITHSGKPRETAPDVTPDDGTARIGDRVSCMHGYFVPCKDDLNLK